MNRSKVLKDRHFMANEIANKVRKFMLSYFEQLDTVDGYEKEEL